MKAILIPVKDSSQAKQRLAACFTQPERTALARAMLEDVFAAVAAARGFDRVFLVSNDEFALEQGRRLGWELIRESHQHSENASVDWASRLCAERGAGSLLRLPADIPLVEPGDIETIFTSAGSAPSCVLVPSRGGDGTNALLRTPPALFPSHFGPESFRQHLAEAGRCAARVEVLRLPRVELDVDEESDLRALAALAAQATATGRWLARAGWLARATVVSG